MPPLLVTGGVVVGKERQYAAGHTDGNIQREHIQLLHNAQSRHGAGIVSGHEFHQRPHCHHGQQILGAGGKTDL